MQIVIDIPQKVYDKVLSGDGTGAVWAGYIKNGTPLPKGHGRVIDESKITTVYYHKGEVTNGAIVVKGLVIDGTDAPTIIEADKEDSDG